ncbi:MAG: carbohydrate ABC transporter permease [Candidatus Thiodiazotropha endolucinida]
MRATRLSVLLSYLLLGGMAALFIVPLLMMFVGSLKPDQSILVEGGSLAAFLPSEVSLQNYADVFRRSDFLRYFFNSLFITGCIVSSGLLVNSMAAYAFARLQWRGRDLLFNLVLALMILPFEAIAIPLFYGASMLGLRDSFSIQIVPFIANAFAIYLFYSFFIGMPKELEEAARLDGASTLRIFSASSCRMPNRSSPVLLFSPSSAGGAVISGR